MPKSMQLEIITPSKLFYKGDIELVIARTKTGDEGFMAGHTWAVKLLDAGELWFQEEGSKDFKIAALAGGFIDVKENIIIFTDAAEWPDDIDLARAQHEKELAEDWLRHPSNDDTEIAQAKIAIAKSMTRMHVKAGGYRRKK
jgi:F-type H+-transporting ATPase subunit epsilon